MRKHLIVIGGGAAGFFCAVNAARMDPSLKLTILEKSNKLLSKVRVSGGGRCNVTHACFELSEMIRHYPRGKHFVKKAFHQFFTSDTVKWFEERGVKLKTEPDGRMFPVTDSSQSIIDCFLKEAKKYGVEILMNREVKKIVRKSTAFDLTLSTNEILCADFVCIATGGAPKSFKFNWLKDLGHHIEEPVPSLFTFNIPKHPITKLMGVSVEKVKIKIVVDDGKKLEEVGPLLITHWGLSGPAVLRLSAWGAREINRMNYDFRVRINWLPEVNEQNLREKFQALRKSGAIKKIWNLQSFGLPSRLWTFLAEQSGVDKDMHWADLPSSIQNKFIQHICGYQCYVKGKTTFKEEFVTAGGVMLSQIDPNTMMSKIVPNLFFAGEVLDVDGITGGYNFQHAWTSGWVASKAIAKRK